MPIAGGQQKLDMFRFSQPELNSKLAAALVQKRTEGTVVMGWTVVV